MWHPEEINESDLEIVLKKIRGIITYVDKIVIWFEKNPHFNMDKLKPLCGDIKECKGYMHWKDKKTGVLRFNHKYAYKLELLQPSRKALLYLRRHTSCSYLINYVELSIDYIVKTLEDVKLLRRFFEACWIKRWKMSKRIVRKGGELFFMDPDDYAHKGTTYYELRKSSKNYVIYSDRPSKINDKLCCHLELRYHNSGSVKREGIDKFDAYINSTFFSALWEKHLQLRMVKDKEEISEKILKTLQRRKKKGNHHILKNICLGLFRADGGVIKAQNVITHGKWFNAKIKFLEKISNKPFLPQIRIMIIYEE